MVEGVKTIGLPDFEDSKLLVISGDPVCDHVEERLLQAINTSRIIEIADAEVVYFLECGNIVKAVSEKVARVLMKSTDQNRKLDGRPNGFVDDPNSWLHGFVVHKSKDRLIVARPLLPNPGMNKLEEKHPGIYPQAWNSPELRDKLHWYDDRWERAANANCQDRDYVDIIEVDF
ncbi:MAG: hypothetical protein NTZ25_02920 [Candidatus Peregrinibacteria bacterium]|nr:hypothetical protein [Candidatus Peregrinibacteria bacterium]